MALVRTPALVLQAFPYGDTSKILRLYTLELGLRSVIAKGALRPKSRYGGVLEPFTEGEAQFYLREGRDLHTLGGFDLVRSRQRIGRSLTAFAGASLLAELVIRSGTEEPHPELFQAVVHWLDEIAGAEADAAAQPALAAQWHIVSLLGFHPEMERCVGCGRELRPEEDSRFDVEAGGAACTLCRPAGRVVDAATRREVAAMGRGVPPAAPPADLALHRALLRAFLAAHLASNHPLRSLDLFSEQLR